VVLLQSAAAAPQSVFAVFAECGHLVGLSRPRDTLMEHPAPTSHGRQFSSWHGEKGNCIQQQTATVIGPRCVSQCSQSESEYTVSSAGCDGSAVARSSNNLTLQRPSTAGLTWLSNGTAYAVYQRIIDLLGRARRMGVDYGSYSPASGSQLTASPRRRRRQLRPYGRPEVVARWCADGRRVYGLW
jgi:hypothetical protein